MDCDKCTTLRQDVINRGNWGVGEGSEWVYGNSVLSTKFFYQLERVPPNLFVKTKKKKKKKKKKKNCVSFKVSLPRNCHHTKQGSNHSEVVTS